MNERFARFAYLISDAVGTPIAFGLALLVVVAWAVTGPFFGFADSWQLVINTGTTIVTFLMVFVIQATQNRETRALHLKVAVAWRDGLEMAIEDDGVGLGTATIAAQGSGHGLGLHGTLMSVVGGTLTAESEPGVFTRISLALPAWAWA